MRQNICLRGRSQSGIHEQVVEAYLEGTFRHAEEQRTSFTIEDALGGCLLMFSRKPVNIKRYSTLTNEQGVSE